MTKAEKAFHFIQRELARAEVFEVIRHGEGSPQDIVRQAIKRGEDMLTQTGNGIYEDEDGNLTDVDGKILVPKEKRQKDEVYSRVVGYMRPVGGWNKGKKAEWNDRTTFKVKIDSPDPLPERDA